MLRRWSLGLGLSLALHAGVGGGVLAVALLRAPMGPVDVELSGVHMEVKDLPLGPAPGADKPKEERAAPRPRARAPRVAEPEGTLTSRESPDKPRPGAAEDPDPAAEEAAAPRVSDVRQLGPEGSRLTVLIRIDRLKATPFATAVDELLVRLPDRRDLLDGTGLDLYESFDALLISTPNPLDPLVTFLAARHRLSDRELRGALERGARATGRTISWRSEGGRPFAERRAAKGGGGAAGAGGGAVSGALAAMRARDERIIVMPSTGLVVVTPPAYRELLLAPLRRPAAVAADGGAAATSTSTAGDGGAAADAAADPAAPAPAWAALLRRIDAEDGLLPPTGVVLVSATDILKPKSGSTADTALLMGLEVPRVMSLVIGTDPAPYLDLTAEFVAEAEAAHWEKEWPNLQRRLRVHPALVLTGFSPLASRATLTRTGSTVRLHETATFDETFRLLQIAAQFMGGGGG